MKTARDVATLVTGLLDRELDAQALREATELTARAATEAQLLSRTVFVFRLGSEWLALPPSVIDEVLELRAMHGLPHRRTGVVRGLVGVRGRLTVLVSLEHLLHGGPTVRPAPKRHQAVPRLVVLVSRGQRLAFEVDEVHGHHRFDPAALRAAPATVSKAVASFTANVLPWREYSVGLLDADLVLHALERHLG